VPLVYLPQLPMRGRKHGSDRCRPDLFAETRLRAHGEILGNGIVGTAINVTDCRSLQPTQPFRDVASVTFGMVCKAIVHTIDIPTMSGAFPGTIVDLQV
jgi:hypothetical protein